MHSVILFPANSYKIRTVCDIGICRVKSSHDTFLQMCKLCQRQKMLELRLLKVHKVAKMKQLFQCTVSFTVINSIGRVKAQLQQYYLFLYVENNLKLTHLIHHRLQVASSCRFGKCLRILSWGIAHHYGDTLETFDPT